MAERNDYIVRELLRELGFRRCFYNWSVNHNYEWSVFNHSLLWLLKQWWYVRRK